MREPETTPLQSRRALGPADAALAGATTGGPTLQSFTPDAASAARPLTPAEWRRTEGGLLERDDTALAAGPRFDRRVGHDGYVWWYVDAFSEDRAYGLTLIAFIGSVFSPY